jgi:hypothetical protein
MIEAPGIAKQSTSFPNPVKDGRACELSGGRNFAILHGTKQGFHVLRWPRRNRVFDDIMTLWGRKVVDHKN